MVPQVPGPTFRVARLENREPLCSLPKASSSYPLSPQRGERVRVRGGKKRLLAIAITSAAAQNDRTRKILLLMNIKEFYGEGEEFLRDGHNPGLCPVKGWILLKLFSHEKYPGIEGQPSTRKCGAGAPPAAFLHEQPRAAVPRASGKIDG